MNIRLYDAKGECVASGHSIYSASAIMKIHPNQLHGFMDDHDYCLVDDPVVLLAVWDTPCSDRMVRDVLGRV